MLHKTLLDRDGFHCRRNNWKKEARKVRGSAPDDLTINLNKHAIRRTFVKNGLLAKRDTTIGAPQRRPTDSCVQTKESCNAKLVAVVRRSMQLRLLIDCETFNVVWIEGMITREMLPKRHPADTRFRHLDRLQPNA